MRAEKNAALSPQSSLLIYGRIYDHSCVICLFGQYLPLADG